MFEYKKLLLPFSVFIAAFWGSTVFPGCQESVAVRKIYLSGPVFEIPPKRTPTDTTSQTILLIGDSMAHFLRRRLNDYCEQNGHEFRSVAWVSGNTEWFADDDILEKYIAEYEPSFIIFVIGSNEMFLRNPYERASNVHAILGKMYPVKSVWVGPPNWKEDTGINAMMLEELGDDKFFLSKNLTFERKAPGDVHPSIRASAMWMDSIAAWIVNESKYPIRMDVPVKKSEKAINQTVLKPKY